MRTDRIDGTDWTDWIDWTTPTTPLRPRRPQKLARPSASFKQQAAGRSSKRSVVRTVMVTVVGTLMMVMAMGVHAVMAVAVWPSAMILISEVRWMCRPCVAFICTLGLGAVRTVGRGDQGIVALLVKVHVLVPLVVSIWKWWRGGRRALEGTQAKGCKNACKARRMGGSLRPMRWILLRRTKT